MAQHHVTSAATFKVDLAAANRTLGMRALLTVYLLFRTICPTVNG